MNASHSVFCQIHNTTMVSLFKFLIQMNLFLFFFLNILESGFRMLFHFFKLEKRGEI